MKKPTHKQILKFKENEISLCQSCYSMTHSILKKGELYCGKCKSRK